MATMQCTRTMTETEQEFENVDLNASNPHPAYFSEQVYHTISNCAQTFKTAIQIEDEQQVASDLYVSCKEFCCIPFGKNKADDPKKPGHCVPSITQSVSDWLTSTSKLTHGKLAAVFSLVLALVQLTFYFTQNSYFQFQALYGIAADNGFATPFNVFYLIWIAALIIGPILIFVAIYLERPKLFLPHIYQTITVLIISISWTMYFVFSKSEPFLAGLMKDDTSSNIISLGSILFTGAVLLLGCIEYYLIVIRTTLEAKDELKLQIKKYGRIGI